MKPRLLSLFLFSALCSSPVLLTQAQEPATPAPAAATQAAAAAAPSKGTEPPLPTSPAPSAHGPGESLLLPPPASNDRATLFPADSRSRVVRLFKTPQGMVVGIGFLLLGLVTTVGLFCFPWWILRILGEVRAVRKELETERLQHAELHLKLMEEQRAQTTQLQALVNELRGAQVDREVELTQPVPAGTGA